MKMIFFCFLNFKSSISKHFKCDIQLDLINVIGLLNNYNIFEKERRKIIDDSSSIFDLVVGREVLVEHVSTCICGTIGPLLELSKKKEILSSSVIRF